MMGTHKDLEVWKNSMDLVKVVYKQTAAFPKEELFSITNQIRRAAVSVPSNISEGSARMNSKEFNYFLKVSFGSLNELETLLIIALDLNYLDKNAHAALQQKIKIITVQLSGLIHAIENKIKNTSHK
jgi:four helix bundle protein